MKPKDEGNNNGRQPRAFAAIPCGDFYSIQAEAIQSILAEAGVKAYIAEDDPSTKGLWESIQKEIDDSDLFIADISSRSPNILLEVGYAIARKPKSRIGIFTAESIEIPSDLRWLICQTYSSLPSFREKLRTWLNETTPGQMAVMTAQSKISQEVFEEDFLNKDLFHRRWSTPPGCSYLFVAEGLRFSGAHFPILTSPLDILGDCEFEFDVRIERAQVGWAVLGTKNPNEFLPSFCVMFTLGSDSKLTPHIWSINSPDPQHSYYRFPETDPRVPIVIGPDGWINIQTSVKGSHIEIKNHGQVLFSADFNSPPYDQVFQSVDRKGGQVGFRCYPGEQATVRRVRVRQLP